MEKIGFYSGFENPLEGFSTGGTLSSNSLSSVRRLGVFPGAIKTPALFLDSFPCCTRCKVNRSLLQQQKGGRTHLPSTVTRVTARTQATGNLPGLSLLSYTDFKSMFINGSMYPDWSSACWGVLSLSKTYLQLRNS